MIAFAVVANLGIGKVHLWVCDIDKARESFIAANA
jgi:hypothetical protein